MKTIKVKEATWHKLMKYKLQLGCKSIEELLDRILKIITAKELEK